MNKKKGNLMGSIVCAAYDIYGQLMYHSDKNRTLVHRTFGNIEPEIAKIYNGIVDQPVGKTCFDKDQDALYTDFSLAIN